MRRVISHAPAIKATELLDKSEQVQDCPHGTPWMLWWIVGVHACWGLALLFEPKVVQSVVVLVGLDWIIDAGATAASLGVCLLVVSTMASIGLLYEERIHDRCGKYALPLVAVLICPQYFLVLAAFISDVYTLAHGEVQGHSVHRWLLLGALAPVVWGALLHTASILERYALNWRRR